jgi:hypothetical protein
MDYGSAVAGEDCRGSLVVWVENTEAVRGLFDREEASL